MNEQKLRLQIEQITSKLLVVRDEISTRMQDGQYQNQQWIADSPAEVRRLILAFDRHGTTSALDSEQMARDVARLIDHTALKPESTEAQIRQLCQEALLYGFASVCVNPHWVPLCAQLLHDSPVMVCTVIGFPLGATTTSSKVFETDEACRNGAQEVDMVLNIGCLKSCQLAVAMQDVRAVVEKAHEHGARVKVIIEAVLLTDEEKIQASHLCQLAGADFVKTSTGFSKGGATINDVALMRHTVGHALGVKAAGGIRTFNDAIRMIKAGASRIGASAGIKIVEGAKSGKWTELKSSSSLY